MELLIAFLFDQWFCCLIVARSQSDSDMDIVETEEGGDLGIVGDDVQDFGGGNFSPAPGVETVCVFPKNPTKCRHLVSCLGVT